MLLIWTQGLVLFVFSLLSCSLIIMFTIFYCVIPTIKIVWNSRKRSNPDLFFPFQIQYTNEHGHWLTVMCIM